MSDEAVAALDADVIKAYVELGLGILIPRGDHYEFLFRSLAEHLAGSQIAEDGVTAILSVARKPWAHEAIRHAAGCLSTAADRTELLSGLLMNEGTDTPGVSDENLRPVLTAMDGLGFSQLYADELPLWEKLRTIAREIYGAEDVTADLRVRAQFDELEAQGYGRFPICVAKTQYSFSTDPDRRGAPTGHIVPVREVRLAGGAEFVVAICGDIMTMPGLPREPSAQRIGLDAAGLIQGLF